MPIVVQTDEAYKADAKKRGAKRWYGYPGAYAYRSKTWCPIKTAKAAKKGKGWQRTLLVHEQRHHDGVPDHPNSAIGAIVEAFKYGLDERAFTRYLRWRKSSNFARAEEIVLAELAEAFA